MKFHPVNRGKSHKHCSAEYSNRTPELKGDITVKGDVWSLYSYGTRTYKRKTEELELSFRAVATLMKKLRKIGILVEYQMVNKSLQGMMIA